MYQNSYLNSHEMQDMNEIFYAYYSDFLQAGKKEKGQVDR